MWSFKRKRLLGFIQLLVCAIIYSRGWLRAWIQCTLHSRAPYCQASSSWITIAPNLIINILYHAQKSPSLRTVLQRMKTGCVIKVYTAHSTRALEFLNCLNVTCVSLPHEELRMKMKSSIQRKIKRKIKKQSRNEPPARKPFRFAPLSPMWNCF